MTEQEKENYYEEFKSEYHKRVELEKKLKSKQDDCYFFIAVLIIIIAEYYVNS